MEISDNFPQVLSGKTVLLVEDEAFCRAQIGAALKKLGAAKVIEAEDGIKAWDVLVNIRIDVLVLDLHLPHVDGLDLLQGIRTGESRCPTDLFVIVTTGSNDPRARTFAASLKADAFLQKPVALMSLIDALQPKATSNNSLPAHGLCSA